MYMFIFVEWTLSTAEQMINLVNLGVVKKIQSIELEGHNTTSDKIKHKFSPDEVVTLSPLLAATNSVSLAAMIFSSSQWQELANNIGENLGTFRLGTSTVDGESGDSVAKICSRANKCYMYNVLFEDIGRFALSFDKYLDEEKGSRRKLKLRGMEGFEEETEKNHRQEIRNLAKKRYWLIEDDMEGLITIQEEWDSFEIDYFE